MPTVREQDGLALSSRNQGLSPAERRLAPSLYRALSTIRERVAAGVADVAALTRAGADRVPEDGLLRLEYLDIVDPADFQPVRHVDGTVVAAGALWVGRTRLIDNVTCTPQETREAYDQGRI